MSFNSDWQTFKLEEVLEALIDYRGKTPKKTDSGIPLITAKIVKKGSILPPNEFIDEKDFDSWMVRGLPKVGDVVLTTEAPLGEVAQLTNDNVALAQRIVTLRGKSNVLDNGFLRYFLMSNIGQSRLRARESGTTVTGIKQSELRLVQINMPDYESQIRISKILHSIDNKLELNNAINKNFEEMAQTLFKRWFVDFEFPNENGEPYKSSGGEFEESELGLIPNGWEISTLGQVIKIKHGFAFKSENFSEETTKRILLTPGNFKIGGGFNDKKLKYYSNQAEVPLDYILKTGDMLITMTDLSKSGDTLGYPAIIPDTADLEILHNQRLGRVIFCTDLPIKGYVYNVLCSKEYRGYILGSATGSTVKHTAPNRIESYKVLIPKKDVLLKFDGIMSSIFDQLSLNYSGNKNLSTLRNILLPKLMSGEIRVPLNEEYPYSQSSDLPLAAETNAHYFTT